MAGKPDKGRRALRIVASVAVALSLWAGQPAVSAAAHGMPDPVTCGHHDPACHHGGAPAAPSAPAQNCCVAHCLLTVLPLSTPVPAAPEPASTVAISERDAPGLTVEPAVPPPRA